MEWSESGTVLGAKRHGEANLILEVMTRDRGRHLGLVRGGRSRRMAALLQVGNALTLTWRARLHEHLGLFQVDGERLRGGFLMERPEALLAAQLCATHLRLVPERDPHPRLYDLMELILDHPDERLTLGALVARFELTLLEELGFGLDLSCCAATGAQDDLVFVSPKSGRAVSAQAGEPYKAKLLKLPAFFRGSLETCDSAALGDAFRLTAFFLDRNVWAPRGLAPPDGRDGLLRRLLAQETPVEAE
ncbi:MAG: DNA repair protein RecO [Pseudomonadota bacterium]